MSGILTFACQGPLCVRVQGQSTPGQMQMPPPPGPPSECRPSAWPSVEFDRSQRERWSQPFWSRTRKSFHGRFRSVPADGRGAYAGVQGCQGGQPRVRNQEGVHLPEGGEEVERVGEEGQRGKGHPLCTGRHLQPLPYFAPQSAKNHPDSDRKARNSLPCAMGRRRQSLSARAPLTRTSRKPSTASLLPYSAPLREAWRCVPHQESREKRGRGGI
jgi:hypothetical protein